MIRADEMIPIEVIEAYLEAVEHGCGAYDVLSRAINAWPGMRNSQHVSFDGHTEHAIILPLPQEPTND